MLMLPLLVVSFTVASPPFPYFPTMVMIGPSALFSVCISIGSSVLNMPAPKVAQILHDESAGIDMRIDPFKVLRL